MPLVLYLRESTVDNHPESEGATEEFQVSLEKKYANLIEQKVKLLYTTPEESKWVNPEFS